MRSELFIFNLEERIQEQNFKWNEHHLRWILWQAYPYDNLEEDGGEGEIPSESKRVWDLPYDMSIRNRISLFVRSRQSRGEVSSARSLGLY
jgi:hypothetical protein